MEKILTNSKLLHFIEKYKYVALVLAVGIVLMLIPTGSETAKEAALPAAEDRILSVEEKLTQILRQVKGAGEVQVLLTEALGEETIYQTNEDILQDDASFSSHGDTVTITDSQRNEQGLVRQQNPPQYMGAIIVCQGGDSPTIRLQIVQAVANVTGISSDRITVLKMK